MCKNVRLPPVWYGTALTACTILYTCRMRFIEKAIPIPSELADVFLPNNSNNKNNNKDIQSIVCRVCIVCISVGANFVCVLCICIVYICILPVHEQNIYNINIFYMHMFVHITTHIFIWNMQYYYSFYSFLPLTLQ